MLEDIISICESFPNNISVKEKLDKIYIAPTISITQRNSCLFQLIYDEYMIEAANPRELLRNIRDWLEDAANMPKFREICKIMRIVAYKKMHDTLRVAEKYTDIPPDILRTIFANIIGVNIIIKISERIYKLYYVNSPKYILIRWDKSDGYYTPIACYDNCIDCEKYIADNKLVMYYDERDINIMGLADLQHLYNRLIGGESNIKMKKAEYINKLINYFLINN
jgi:hypothetical protein